MSVFIVPKITIGEINNLDKVKLYLTELNKKIRFLSENVDGDNIVPSEYRKFYQDEEKAVELVHKYSGEELRIHAVVGVHPEHADKWNEEASKKLEELCGGKGSSCCRGNRSGLFSSG